MLSRKAIVIDFQVTQGSHLIQDDLFLINLLRFAYASVGYLGSTDGIENVTRNISDVDVEFVRWYSKLPRPIYTLFHVLWSRIPDEADIWFNSLEPWPIALYLVFKKKRNHRLYALTTNTILTLNQNSRRFAIRFYRYVMSQVTVCFVSSDYEKNTYEKIVGSTSRARFVVKGYQQFSKTWAKRLEKKNQILFVGKREFFKSTEMLVPLVDVLPVGYNLRVVGCPDIPENRLRLFHQDKNIVVVSREYRTLSNEEYEDEMLEAAYVFLAGGIYTEGLISGVFCDAVATGTPIIAPNMAPYDDIYRKFGDLGYLYEHHDMRRIAIKGSVDYLRFKKNVLLFKKYNGPSNIKNQIMNEIHDI